MRSTTMRAGATALLGAIAAGVQAAPAVFDETNLPVVNQTQPAASGIEANYQRLCGPGGRGDAETCAALKQAIAPRSSAPGSASADQTTHDQPAAPAGGFGLTVQKARGIFYKADVIAVAPGSPAEAAGLKVGDQLLQAKGSSVFSSGYYFGSQQDVETWLGSQPAGTPHKLWIKRDGKAQSIELAMDPAWSALPPDQRPVNQKRAGLGGLIGFGGNSDATEGAQGR